MANSRSNVVSPKSGTPKTTPMNHRAKKKPNMKGSQPSMYPKGKYPS